MKVRENTEVVEQVMSKLRGRQFRPKTFLVTRLIRCPRKTFFKMVGVKEVIPDFVHLTFARGRAHHSILEVFPLREIRRRKEAYDGTPIGADIDMIGDRITEIYTTTLSSSKIMLPSDAINVFPIKLKQLRAYCYMENEHEGDLLAFFLFGDYSRFIEIFGEKKYVGLRPILRNWTFEFLDSELLEVWDLMNNNLAEIKQAFKDGMPPLVCGEEFECKSCGYDHLCFGDEPIAPRDTEKVILSAMKKTEDML